MTDTTWWVQPTVMPYWPVAALAAVTITCLVTLLVVANRSSNGWTASRKTAAVVIWLVGFIGIFGYGLALMNVNQSRLVQAAATSQTRLETLLSERYNATVTHPDRLTAVLTRRNRPDRVGPVELNVPGRGPVKCVVATPADILAVRAYCGVEPAVTEAAVTGTTS